MEGEGLNFVYVNGIIDTGCKEKWGELFVSPEEAIGGSGGDYADFLNYIWSTATALATKRNSWTLLRRGIFT